MPLESLTIHLMQDEFVLALFSSVINLLILELYFSNDFIVDYWLFHSTSHSRSAFMRFGAGSWFNWRRQPIVALVTSAVNTVFQLVSLEMADRVFFQLHLRLCFIRRSLFSSMKTFPTLKVLEAKTRTCFSNNGALVIPSNTWNNACQW